MSDWMEALENKFPPAETIVFPVIAFRIWYISRTLPPRLKSITTDTIWEPCQRMEAKCTWNSCVCKGLHLNYASYDASAHRDVCGAGIYGMKAFDRGFKAYNYEVNVHKPFNENPVSYIVFGKVYLWGKIIEHELGFRAQYAYPSGIYWTAEQSPEIADTYRVPLLALGFVDGVFQKIISFDNE